MSREENNRYLRDVTQSQLRKLPILGWLGAHPFRKLLIIWAVLLVLWYGFYAWFSNPSPFSGDGEWPVPELGVPQGMVREVLLYVVLFLAVFGVALLRQRLLVRKARRKEAEALQQPTPEALLQFMDALIPATSTFPDADLYRAHNRALARTLYGQDAQVLHELNQVNWKGKAPLLRALERGNDALLQLLCKDDPEQALTLGREALALADINPALPGASKSGVFYGVIIHAAELLTGKATPEGMQALEHHHEASSFIVIRLLSAWALRAAATQVKDTERAERMRQFLQTHAPHCAPLQRLPSRATAEG